MQQEQIKTSSKPSPKRFYGYTNNTNAKWIEKESKNFGSKAAFLDALITTARKNKIAIEVPKTKKMAKKVTTKSRKVVAK